MGDQIGSWQLVDQKYVFYVFSIFSLSFRRFKKRRNDMDIDILQNAWLFI